MSSTSITGPQSKILDYYNTLFDHGEDICVAYNAKGRDVHSIDSVLALPDYENLQYICINPLNDRRLDENVTSLRNFLFENDSGLSKRQQAQLIKDSGIPYSALVWSGNKSIHIIVSMETPLTSRGFYDFVWRWIYNILCSYVPEEHKYDEKTKNPSRFSRAPGGTNVKFDKNGNEIHRGKQDLIICKGRVPDAEMEAWLFKHRQFEPVIRQYELAKQSGDEMAHPDWLSGWTQFLLANGIHEGKRNDQFHAMAYDFGECGFDCEAAIAYVMNNALHLNDFPQSEIETTFRSAYKIMERRRSEGTAVVTR